MTRVLLHRSGGRLLAVIVACVACAFAPGLVGVSAAPPAPSTYYGANVQPIFEKGFVPPDDWNGLIAAMSADDLQVARMDAAWSWVEPQAPVNGVHTYDWNPAGDPTHSMDDLVSLLASNHVRMLAVLAIAPSWAGGSGEEMTSAHDSDFVAYAAAFAARYGVNGTFWTQNPQLPYLPVEQFEIWTEANSTNFWTGNPDPSEYVNVLRPLYAAVHGVDPGAQVLASIGWENATAYVSQLYQLGVKGSIDGLAFHPYAPDVPSTVGLVQAMRATLVASGDPSLPIYDTELGEPAAPNSAADGTRAAMLSLIGDALAHSDCNVQSFDVYALTGSDTNAEPISEGYMGILDDLTDAPNITGQALIAASRRWQADPQGGLVLCGGGTPSSASLLPLGLALTHTSATCVSATITYYGNPLQSAQIILRTADGRIDPAGTSPTGQTQMCLQNGPPISSFTVYAEISSPVSTATFANPDIAQSATYSCPVSVSAPTASCTLVTPAPSGTGGGTTPSSPGTTTTTTSVPGTTKNGTSSTVTTTTTSTSTTSKHGSGSGSGSGGAGNSAGSGSHARVGTGASGVHWLAGCSVRLALVRVGALRTTFRARLLCRTARQPAVRSRLVLVRRGHRSTTLPGGVTLSAGRWHSFSLKAVLRAGERVTISVAADKAAGVRALGTTLTATSALLRTAR